MVDKVMVKINDFNRLNETVINQEEEIKRLKGINEANSIMIKELVEDFKNSKKQAYKQFAYQLKAGVPQETGIIRCSDIDWTLEYLTKLANEIKVTINEIDKVN